MPALENASNVEYVVNGETLVIRRSLNVKNRKEDVEQQREYISY
jgi:hypothetical protein